MATRIAVYLILKPTGQFDADGAELCLVIDVKLTNASAVAVAERHEGAKVRKIIADKFTD